MVRLDHLSLPVSDWRRSRDWYVNWLGFEVEFELPERDVVAVRDDADLTIFLSQGDVAACPEIVFTVQVDDVEAKHRELAAGGATIAYPPMKTPNGYGAEVLDPDGYRFFLWDQASMREKGG